MRRGLLLLAVLAACKLPARERVDAGSEKDRQAARARAEAAEAERKQALAEILPRKDLAHGAEACPFGAPMAPRPLGDTALSWPHDSISGLQLSPGDMTSSYLGTYLRMVVRSEVEIVPAPGSGTPFERAGFDGPTVTLIIDQWSDPILPAHAEGGSRFVPGRLIGRVVIWDPASHRYACGAPVSAQNGDVTLVHTTTSDYSSSSDEDPLSKVRIDLINEALRVGLAGPWALTPPGALPDAGAGKACAASAGKVAVLRVIVDLRGLPADRLAKARFLDDVTAKVGKRKPVERVWLFDAHTFDAWDQDAFVDGIGRWGKYLVAHPVAVDEAVVLRIDEVKPSIPYLLQSSGLTVYGDDATLCSGGVEEKIATLAGKGAGGVQVVEVPAP